MPFFWFVSCSQLVVLASSIWRTVRPLTTLPLLTHLFHKTELSSRGQWATARQVYTSLSDAGAPPHYSSYQLLIAAAARAGDLTSALGALRDAQARGLSINKVTYCCLISACGRQRRRGLRWAALAYELWRELERAALADGAPLDAAAFRAGMKACVDVGRVDEAWALLRRMAEVAREAPDVRAYNILLKGLSRGGDRAALDRALARMRAAGVAPSAVTYNTLIDGYVRGGALAEAEACAAAAAGAGVALDAWSYSTLLKGHVRAGDLAAAEGVLEAMASAGVAPTAVTFTTLVDGYVRGGDLAAARSLLGRMAAAGVRPTVVTWNTLLRGAARVAAPPGAALAPEALALLDEMAAAGVPPSPDSYNTLMSAALEGGDAALALVLRARATAAGLAPDGLTYTLTIRAHGALGQPGEAVAAFRALTADPAAQLDLQAYSALADALCRSGDVAAAERVAARGAAFAKRQGARRGGGQDGGWARAACAAAGVLPSRRVLQGEQVSRPCPRARAGRVSPPPAAPAQATHQRSAPPLPLPHRRPAAAAGGLWRGGGGTRAAAGGAPRAGRRAPVPGGGRHARRAHAGHAV